MLIENGAQVN
jgi:ankyrin repeat protein